MPVHEMTSCSTPATWPSRWRSTSGPASRRRPRPCRRSTSTTRAAASCSTRSPGCRSTTRPAPSAPSSSGTSARSRRLTRAETLVELGSGTSEKTRLLLGALSEVGSLRRFVPFDVDPAVLKDASAAVADEFPGLDVEPVVGDFETAPRRAAALTAPAGRVPRLHDRQPRAAAAGALPDRGPRGAWPRATGSCSAPTWSRIPQRLVAAYDDAAGGDRRVRPQRAARSSTATSAPTSTSTPSSTARCGTPSTSGSRCVWSRRRDQRVKIRTARPRRSHFDAGEQVRTEISAKFRRAGVEGELRGGRPRAGGVVDRPARRLRAVVVGPEGARTLDSGS